jgi:hypothetical protein
MKTPILIMALAMLAPSSPVLAQDSAPQPVKRVLFFSKSVAYIHSVIRPPLENFAAAPSGEVPGLAFKVLKELGDKNAIAFTFSKDGSLFSKDYLSQFDAFFFITTGDLTQVGDDGQPPMTPEGKAALLDAIAQGKGFIGSHCASDTFHSPGGKTMVAARFVADANPDPYIRMIGGEFMIHGAQQPSHLVVADGAFPGVSALAPDNDAKEEWYTLKNFAPDLHVVLVQDTSGMEGWMYARPAYPSTWAHLYGKGRVFYTSMGHRDDMWRSAAFQSVLLGGINWAVGRSDADLTPNLDKVAPGASKLPAWPGPNAN